MPAIKLIFVAVLCCLSFSVLAAPSKTPRFLMSQPLTVFDWGLIEIRRKLESFRKLTLFNISYLGGSAEYLWDDNLIVLLGKFQGRGTAEECADNLKLLKGGFADFEWDVDKQAGAAAQVLNQLFNHPAGFASNGKPLNVGQNLISIVRVEATVYVEKDSILKVGAQCTSDFRTGEIKAIQ